MRLVYRTAIATLVQFAAMVLLGFANGVHSVVITCRDDSPNCTSNLLVSLIFFLLSCAWFGAIWVLGSMAQETRRKRLAQLLILLEIGVAMIALFNARHNSKDKLSLFTSLVDLGLAAWVIVLAFKLSRSGTGRIVSRRHRRTGVS